MEAVGVVDWCAGYLEWVEERSQSVWVGLVGERFDVRDSGGWGSLGILDLCMRQSRFDSSGRLEKDGVEMDGRVQVLI